MATFMVVTAEQFVTVRVVYKTEVTHDIDPWQQLRLNASSHSGYLSSDKPVQVTFVLDNACVVSSHSKPSFVSLVIPRELFMESYYWYNFDHYGMTHFLMYLCRSVDIRDLILDNKFIYKMTGLQYNSVSYRQHLWYKGEMQVYAGHHTFHSRNGSKFGLYLYGVESGTYMHPAGFISSPINTICQRSLAVPGDMLDNDCGGNVDEERNDSLGDGGWSHWREWYCVYCANDTITRHSVCRKCEMEMGSGAMVESQYWNKAAWKHARGNIHGNMLVETFMETCSWKHTWKHARGNIHGNMLVETFMETCSWKHSWKHARGNIHGNMLVETYMETCSWKHSWKHARGNIHGNMLVETFMETCSWKHSWKHARGNIHGNMLVETYMETCSWKHSWKHARGNIHGNMFVETYMETWIWTLCNQSKPSGKGSTCEGKKTEQKFGSCSDICERGDGKWGDWTSWDCSQNCKEKYPIRTRICDSPPPSRDGDNCTGSSFQYGDKLCQRPCAIECPLKTWGSNCSRTCTHCKDECAKDTGICTLCESGFQSPQLQCSVECETFTFGPNCEGNCFKKCDSSDCIDRVLGICPPEQRKFLWLLLLLLLPVPIGTFFYLQVRHEKKDESIPVEIIQKKVAEIARIQSNKSFENQTSLTSLAKMAGIYYFPPEDTEESLEKFISENGRMNEENIRVVTQKIVEGISYLHKQNIVHRNLKSSNILIDKEISVKITEPLLTKYYKDSSEEIKTTYRFRAPETFHGCFQYSSDIWFIGCLVIHMLTGEPPYLKLDEEEVCLKLTRNNAFPAENLPDNISVTLKILIYSVLEKTPELRPTANSISSEDAFISERYISKEIPNLWKRGELLGRGQYGKVFQVIDEKQPLEIKFVVKDIKLTLQGKRNISLETKTTFRREAEILLILEDHERIVPFYGFVSSQNTISIFLGYMALGSLCHYYEANGPVTEEKCCLYTRQILEGLIFLHDLNIVHRDVKGLNVLLETEEKIRLTDFGISECINDEINNGKHGIKADIWSLGCTVVEMLTGKVPYNKISFNGRVIFKVGNGEPPEYPDILSRELKEFLDESFVVNPNMRKSSKEMLDLSFVKTATADLKPVRLELNENVINEVDVDLDDERNRKYCKKNPGHEKFIPVGKFQMKHLPANVQDPLVYEFIKATADLTVRIDVNYMTHWMTTEVIQRFVVSREIVKHFELREEESLHSSTYCLESRRYFRVAVLIDSGHGSHAAMGSFQAVPVEGWGKKYITTVLTYESFKFYTCHGDGLPLFTSVIIHGTNPLGVISGNCEALTQLKFCNSSTGQSGRSTSPDRFIEMLLPVDSFGKDFIVFSMSASDQQSSGYLFVVASENGTRVTLSGSGRTNVEKKIKYIGEFLELEAMESPLHITSRKKVGVIYFQYSTCDGSGPSIGPGESVMTLILPTNLYMDAYFWDTVAAEKNLIHYVIYICTEADYNTGLQLDGTFLNEYPHNFTVVVGKNPTWQTGQLEIDAGSHEFFSVFGARFGVYLYGVGSDISYMNIAGFLSIGLAADCRFSIKVRPGDLEDDDCDGLIDEERLDRIDNDGDGEVDEDLLPLPPKSGGWSQWLPWWCTSCSSQILYRKRQCNRPVPTKGGIYCRGEGSEIKLGICKEICETVHGRWGEWSHWECTSRCHLTTEFRKRKCNNPEPSDYGRHCEGHGHQDRSTKWCSVNCGKKASAGWGLWSEWACQSDCSQKKMVRFRDCDNPASEPGGMDCLGPPLEFTVDNRCSIVCPFACPVGSWGINCTYDCSHCESDCNKITGMCHSCSAGFKAPDRACSIGCGEFQYGVMCEGACEDKCYGEDCTERVHGTCPVLRTVLSYFVLLIFVLPVLGIVVFIHVYIYRLHNPSTETEILRTHSSIMREYLTLLERKLSFN
ncbi:hypothetical protein Btru_014827 [Bulinus truncatus]|nr:hypothetical protein Btru_014827 [Bulinus truncatus]